MRQACHKAREVQGPRDRKEGRSRRVREACSGGPGRRESVRRARARRRNGPDGGSGAGDRHSCLGEDEVQSRRAIGRGPRCDTDRTGTPVWEKMKFNLAALLDAGLAATPTGPRTGLAKRAKLEFYAPLVDGMADAAARCAEMPEIQPVLLLAEAAVSLRAVDCKVRAASADYVP